MKKNVIRLMQSASIALVTLFLISNVATVSAAQAGPSFSAPVNLSGTSNAIYPAVASSGLYIYVVWTEGSGGIFIQTSSNGGTTWSGPMRISNTGTAHQYPVIAANGSGVYVAWAQYTSGNLHITFARSTNYGASFSTPVQIDGQPASGFSITPYVAASGEGVYVVFSTATTDSFLVSSSNYGATFSAPMTISAKTCSGKCHEPQVYAFGSSAYAVSDGSKGVLLTHNYGVTWSRVAFPSGCCASEPWIAAYGNNVLAGGETKTNTSVINIAYSNDAGATWHIVHNFQGSINAWAPMPMVYGNDFYIPWRTDPGSSNSQEYVAVSTNAGSTWTLHTIGLADKDNEWPFYTYAYQSEAFIMWAYQPSPGVWYPVVSYTTDNGATWSTPDNLGTTSASHIVPEQDTATGSMVGSGATIFTAWQTPGSNIYFSSGTA